MRNRPTILVIDDQIGQPDSSWQAMFLQYVGAKDKADRKTGDYPYSFDFCTGCTPDGACSVNLVLDRIGEGWNRDAGQFWALILLDVQFGKAESFGYEILETLRSSPEFGTDLPVVMLTKERGRRQEAAHGGADGFLPKVGSDGQPALTRSALEAVVFREGLLPDTRRLPREDDRLVGNSLAFLKTLRAIRKTVRNGTILQMCLLGEPGVGKTELARYARDITNGPSAPFQHITANPGNPHLQLGALFGCWPGAYNDAPKNGAPGSFELAHEGMLFLDEIANLSPESQRAPLGGSDYGESSHACNKPLRRCSTDQPRHSRTMFARHPGAFRQCDRPDFC